MFRNQRCRRAAALAAPLFLLTGACVLPDQLAQIQKDVADKPVRPGDTLTYTRTVLESRPSASRAGVGLVKHRWDAVNQAGETVLTMEGWGMFGRKPR